MRVTSAPIAAAIFTPGLLAEAGADHLGPVRDRVRAKDMIRYRRGSGDAVALRGGFTVTPEEFGRIATFGFVSGRSTHADRLATIRDTYSRFGVTIDTHTADGVKVAREHRGDGSVPMIVLETALPIKFAEATGANWRAHGWAERAARGQQQVKKVIECTHAVKTHAEGSGEKPVS